MNFDPRDTLIALSCLGSFCTGGVLLTFVVLAFFFGRKQPQFPTRTE